MTRNHAPHSMQWVRELCIGKGQEIGTNTSRHTGQSLKENMFIKIEE